MGSPSFLLVHHLPDGLPPPCRFAAKAGVGAVTRLILIHDLRWGLRHGEIRWGFFLQDDLAAAFRENVGQLLLFRAYSNWGIL